MTLKEPAINRIEFQLKDNISFNVGLTFKKQYERRKSDFRRKNSGWNIRKNCHKGVIERSKELNEIGLNTSRTVNISAHRGEI